MIIVKEKANLNEASTATIDGHNAIRTILFRDVGFKSYLSDDKKSEQDRLEFAAGMLSEIYQAIVGTDTWGDKGVTEKAMASVSKASADLIRWGKQAHKVPHLEGM